MSTRFVPIVLSAALVSFAGAGTGCKGAAQPNGKAAANPLDPTYAAWKANDFQGAYEKGESVANSMRYGPAVRQEAAFVAGKAARKTGRRYEAVSLLDEAAQSGDKSLRGQALAERGMVQCELEKFKEGSASLLKATEYLEGDELALAYFNAGIAEQKLNFWSEARTHLTLAVKYARNEALRADARRQIAVTGYTLQVGTFLDARNALRASDDWRQKTAALHLADPRVIDGTNNDELESWVLDGCFLSNVAYPEGNYESSDPNTVTLTVRYDNATNLAGPNTNEGNTVGGNPMPNIPSPTGGALFG